VAEGAEVATLISVVMWGPPKTLGTLIVLKFTTVTLAQSPAGFQGTEGPRPRVQKQALRATTASRERAGGDSDQPSRPTPGAARTERHRGIHAEPHAYVRV
jgi:hypothetical protein